MITHLGAVREPSGLDFGDILLLGEDNPQSPESQQFQLYPRPSGCAGHRLQSLVLGLTVESDYLSIWRANLCSPSWNPSQARRRAIELLAIDAPWSVVVMLGRKVASTFDAALITPTSLLPFTSCEIVIENRTFTLISLPHPSGRNKDWNEAGYTKAQKLMRTHCPSIRWGGTLF